MADRLMNSLQRVPELAGMELLLQPAGTVWLQAQQLAADHELRYMHESH
jgi:hypothetical protein